MSTVQVTKNRDLTDLKATIAAFLEANKALLPGSPEAKVLLKPNFNSTMNALTGNTTDLRLIAAAIVVLQGLGYTNITIGEGTNSGFYRNKIDVAANLRAKELAAHLGVRFVDLNYSQGVAISLDQGVVAEVARECLEADLFINLPKLKMHHEVGISVCLKNMMGCLVGQDSKKKMHRNLALNILILNRYLRPHLHIVDALIAMEGNGPSDGVPVRMDTVVAGTDPLLLDMTCAELVGMPYREVTYLRLAGQLGLLGAEHRQELARLDLVPFKRKLARPDPPLSLKVVCHPRLQKYFQALRHAPGLYELCNTQLVGTLFTKLGIRQEHFIKEPAEVRLALAPQACPPGCRKCSLYCPVGLEVPSALREGSPACIGCLYCFMVCPREAIRLEGSVGFLRAQLDKYDRMVRERA